MRSTSAKTVPSRARRQPDRSGEQPGSAAGSAEEGHGVSVAELGGIFHGSVTESPAGG